MNEDNRFKKLILICPTPATEDVVAENEEHITELALEEKYTDF